MFAQIIAICIFVTMFLLIILDKFERHYITLGSGALVLVLVFGVCMRSMSAIWETLNLAVRQVTFPVQRRTVAFQKCGQPFRAFAHILHHRGYRLVFHRKNIVVLVHHNFGFSG